MKLKFFFLYSCLSNDELYYKKVILYSCFYLKKKNNNNLYDLFSVFITIMKLINNNHNKVKYQTK